MPNSTKQLAFFTALATITRTSPVSRQDLLAAAHLIGNNFPPAWIVKDTTRHAGRGLFHVPEIVNAAKTVPASVTITPATATAAVAAPAPAPVAPPVQGVKHATVSSFKAEVLGMTGGERDQLIPPSNAEYVPWGHFDDIATIIKARIFAPVFVTGLSGNGKTTMIEQVCAKLGRECFRVNIVAETDEDDLFGGFRLVDGDMVWHDGAVVSAMKRGAVLLLDEIDLGSDKLMCLQSVLEGKGVFLKKINQWVAPAEGFTIFATANTKGKGSDDGRFVGTRVMNEAMLDRFDYTYEQEYAPRSTEKKILLRAMKKYNKVEDQFADDLVRWAEMLRATFREGACDEVISTRRLLNIVKAFSMFDNKDKAIRLSLARFDQATSESFYSSWTKIVEPEPTPAPAAAAAPRDAATAPF
jgi:MoxR-like ATPase